MASRLIIKSPPFTCHPATTAFKQSSILSSLHNIEQIKTAQFWEKKTLIAIFLTHIPIAIFFVIFLKHLDFHMDDIAEMMNEGTLVLN